MEQTNLELNPLYNLAFNPESAEFEVIVKYSGDITEIARDLQVVIEILGDGYAIITLNLNQVQQLYNYSQIEYVELPKVLTYVLKDSRVASCVNAVTGPEYGLDGKGTIIAIIDSGIDYTHPDFINEDGTSRILYIWDQSRDGKPPEGFSSGTEYTNAEINEALNSNNPFDSIPRIDMIGHGTAVAGVAAGNGRSSNRRYLGIAPNASLIVVKLGKRGRESFALTTEIMRALNYVVAKAESLNMPISINLSFGTNNGSHDGGSLFEKYIDEIAERWKTVISVGSGNEGYAGHHFSSKLATNQTMDVTFVTGVFLDFLYVSIWKNFVDTFTFELISPTGASTGIMSADNNVVRIVIDGVSVLGIFGQPNHYNEDQEIYFFLSGDPIPIGVWTIRVHSKNSVNGTVHMWLPTIEEVSNQTSFTRSNTQITLTIPSTANNVITVGGYNARTMSAVNFSGQGYTRKNVYVKPDLVAPAVDIISTKTGGGYDSFSGTSIAAPFVTGAASLMMQWGIVNGNDLFLYGQRVKAFLRKGARRNMQMEYPNPILGYGELCVRNSIDYLIEYNKGAIQ